MASDVGVWLFRLRQCGYFQSSRPRADAAPEFGDIAGILQDLKDWSTGRRMSETTTGDIPDGSDLLPTYLLGLEKSRNGDVLLGLWNQVTFDSNRIASIGHDDIVGQAVTEYVDVDESRIPGFATYFWIMPEARRVAAVRVSHQTNGLQAFERYLSNFLTYVEPRHVVLAEQPEDEDLVEITGYRRNADDDGELLSPKFSLGSIQKTGDVEAILARRSDIKRVICRTTLTQKHREDRAWWQRGLNIMSMGIGERMLQSEVPVQVDLPLAFSDAELRETIVTWQKHLETTLLTWDDLGFVFKGESTPYWLSKSYARKTVAVDIEWIDTEQVNMQALLHQLQRHRAGILAIG